MTRARKIFHRGEAGNISAASSTNQKPNRTEITSHPECSALHPPPSVIMIANQVLHSLRFFTDQCRGAALVPAAHSVAAWLLRNHSSPKRPHEQQRSGPTGRNCVVKTAKAQYSASKRADLNGGFRADVVSTRTGAPPELHEPDKFSSFVSSPQ